MEVLVLRLHVFGVARRPPFETTKKQNPIAVGTAMHSVYIREHSFKQNHEEMVKQHIAGHEQPIGCWDGFKNPQRCSFINESFVFYLIVETPYPNKRFFYKYKGLGGESPDWDTPSSF